MTNSLFSLSAIMLALLATPALAQHSRSEPPAAQSGSDDPFADDSWNDEQWTEPSPLTLRFAHELGLSVRTQDDPYFDRKGPMQEWVGTAELEYRLTSVTFAGDLEIVADGVTEQVDVDYQATAEFNLSPSWQAKVGRQILTWGTGDYLFVNDLFAKDWQSFFNGRDDRQLKQQQLALKLSHYNSWLNLNYVAMPSEADQYITGDYFSFYAPIAGEDGQPILIAPGQSAPKPSGVDHALRLYRSIDRFDVALYGYHGQGKQPSVLDAQGNMGHVAMNSYGASVSGPLASGLMKAEWGRYIQTEPSLDGQWQKSMWLIGYDSEWLPRFNVGWQWQHEHYEQRLGAAANRDLLTLSLNYRLWQDKLTLRSFVFYSPDDKDSYLRLLAQYRLDDHWLFSAGANLFNGNGAGMFSQFETGSNGYLRMKYHF